MPSPSKPARPRVTVHNVVSPNHVMQVDGLKYEAGGITGRVFKVQQTPKQNTPGEPFAVAVPLQKGK